MSNVITSSSIMATVRAYGYAAGMVRAVGHAESLKQWEQEERRLLSELQFLADAYEAIQYDWIDQPPPSL